MQRRAANTQHLCVLPTMRRWFRRGNGKCVKRHCRQRFSVLYSDNSAFRYGPEFRPGPDDRSLSFSARNREPEPMPLQCL